MVRILYELERMGYIKIARGSRYKGFEYKITKLERPLSADVLPTQTTGALSKALIKYRLGIKS